MGNIYLSTYNYDLEINFNSYDGTFTEINKDYVKYLTIDHNFDRNVMPILYIKINIPPKLYGKMIEEQGKSKVYLKLYRIKDKGATSSIAQRIIYDSFDYYMTDNPDTVNKLDEVTKKDAVTSYKTCLVGLLKLDLQKENQRAFEGVYKNTNSMSMVQDATKKMKMVIQPFKNNTYFDSLIIPPIPTIGQFINYINRQSAFYDESYVYYMDLDKTYLRSNDGSYIDAKDGDRKIIAFDIRDLSNSKAFTTGMVEDPDQDAYIIYSSDADIIVDRVTSSNINNITTVNPIDGSTSKVSYVDTSKITNIDTNSGMTIFKVNTDSKKSKVLTKRIAENSITLKVSKIDVDSKVFTLNKQYVLSNYEQNPKYCGVYYLCRKQEIYLRNGNKMSCQVDLTLKKCADFIK